MKALVKEQKHGKTNVYTIDQDGTRIPAKLKPWYRRPIDRYTVGFVVGFMVAHVSGWDGWAFWMGLVAVFAIGGATMYFLAQDEDDLSRWETE